MVTAEKHVALPEALDRPVRKASVPPHLRDVFARVPVTLTLEAELPAEAAAVPPAAYQLLKIALLVPRLQLERLTLLSPSAPPRLTVRCGDRCCGLGPAELAQGLTALAPHLLEALLEKEHLTRVIDAFAFQSTNLEALGHLTNRMLRCTEVDAALYVMLVGITSGAALGFNRAALFLYDELRGCFVGSTAIGPFDAQEACQIWETIEYEDKRIEQQIEEGLGRHGDTRFQHLVRSLELTECPFPGDEVAAARRTRGPQLFLKARSDNPSLAPLSTEREFILAAIQPHDRLLGLLFVDNLYSGATVSLDQLRFLRFYLDQAALLWENLSLLRQVEVLAHHDALTGVLNRRAFESRMDEERRRCQETQQAFSLLLLDLDWFKQINDTKGHEAGDEVLRSVSALLREALRPTDTIARFGGDEFMVLLPGCAREGAAVIAERVGRTAREKGVSLSVGVASWPSDCAEPSALLAAADANLYAAKRAGRGRVCLGSGQVVVF